MTGLFPDAARELHALLEHERACLLAGRFDDLADLQARKLGLADSLARQRPPARALAALSDRAAANQRLMAAAGLGLKAAMRRLGELSRLDSGQGLYGKHGARQEQTSAPRVLRRL